MDLVITLSNEAEVKELLFNTYSPTHLKALKQLASQGVLGSNLETKLMELSSSFSRRVACDYEIIDYSKESKVENVENDNKALID